MDLADSALNEDMVRMKTLLTPAAALLIAAAVATPAMAGDAVKGAASFKTKCQLCHVIAPGAKGSMAPNLLGVVGRNAGTTDFAMYSPQLKAFGKAWTPALIDKWLAGPAQLVPGARMAINVPDAKERGDIVAYLATLKK